MQCSGAISDVIVEACHDTSCVNVTATIANNGRGMTAFFSKLIENRKYAVMIHVLYNGGVEQQSQAVEISKLCSHLNC